MADTVLQHPNRDKAESKATRAVVILLLLTSALLIAVVTFGGWSQLQGAQMISIFYVIIYIVMAYFVTKWNRGVLPVAAGLAILFAVVAAVAGPAWFERDKAGFDNPTLEPSILGLLTLILVPVQLLLVAFAMRGFQQQWSVEVEVRRDEAERHSAGGDSSGARPAGVAISPYARPRISTLLARVAERHTRLTQNHCPKGTCGFESHPGHPPIASVHDSMRTCVRMRDGSRRVRVLVDLGLQRLRQWPGWLASRVRRFRDWRRSQRWRSGGRSQVESKRRRVGAAAHGCGHPEHAFG